MSLRVSALSVRKGGRTIVDDVSLTAPRGAITGLIGPNGAGKSTLLGGMIGLVPATGTVTLADRDLLTMPRRDRARLAAFVEQAASTEERLAVRDVVALGRIPFEAAWQAEPSPEDRAIVAKALNDVDMSDFADRRFATLSGGEQQRVHVARALTQQPQLLLLDEPTSHLDIRAQLQLLGLLRRKAEAGMTVVLAIHDLNLAARYCNHLVVLHHRRVVAEGLPADILTPRLLLDVYGVVAHVETRTDRHYPSIFYENDAPTIPD